MGEGGNKAKGINIFSILVKCIHVWFDLARGDCWLIPRVITLFWSVCDLVCHDKQWFLNNEGDIFETRNFTFAQLNILLSCFRISRKRGVLFYFSGL